MSRAASIILVALLAGAACAGPGRLLVVMTRADLQREVEPLFPIHENLLVAGLELAHPEVLLEPTRHDVGLRLVVNARIGLRVFQGTAGVRGELAYDAVRGTLSMRQPRVEVLHLEHVAPEHLRLLESAINSTLAAALPSLTLYRFEAGEARFLRSVKVEKGAVVLELGV